MDRSLYMSMEQARCISHPISRGNSMISGELEISGEPGSREGQRACLVAEGVHPGRSVRGVSIGRLNRAGASVGWSPALG